MKKAVKSLASTSQVDNALHMADKITNKKL